MAVFGPKSLFATPAVRVWGMWLSERGELRALFRPDGGEVGLDQVLAAFSKSISKLWKMSKVCNGPGCYVTTSILDHAALHQRSAVLNCLDCRAAFPFHNIEVVSRYGERFAGL